MYAHIYRYMRIVQFPQSTIHIRSAQTAAMDAKTSGKRILKIVKPYVAMVLLQFSFVVMYVTLLATLKKGMNQSVMFVYRNVVAATVIAPFALWFERPVLDQNFYLMGAQRTSAGFASALENINPAITFAICLLLRVEKLNIRQRHGLAKVLGVLLGVSGAIVMILYKGPFVIFFWTKGRENHSSSKTDAGAEASNSLRWLKGTLMVLVSCFSWSSFLILQTNTLKSYPAKLSLTVMISSIGAIINAVIALVVNRGSFQAWILGWDMRIFAVVYSGVMCTAVMYYVLAMVMKEKGPVFASAFNPLTMVMTAILSSIVLAERTALGTSRSSSETSRTRWRELRSRCRASRLLLDRC